MELSYVVGPPDHDLSNPHPTHTLPMGMSRHAPLSLNLTIRDPHLLRKWSGPLGTIIYLDRSNNKVCAKNRLLWPPQHISLIH